MITKVIIVAGTERAYCASCNALHAVKREGRLSFVFHTSGRASIVAVRPAKAVG